MNCDVDLPEDDVTIVAPFINISVKGSADVDLLEAEVEMDVDGKPKNGGFKMPKFKMPGFGVSAGAGSPSGGAKLDADISVKDPTVKGDLPKGKLSVKGPKIKRDAKVDLPVGEVELDAKGKPIRAGFGIKMPKFKGPEFHLPSFKGAQPGEFELDAKGKPIKAGFGIKMPKFKGPEFHLPSFKGYVKSDGPPSYDAVAAAPSSYVHPKGGTSVELYNPDVKLEVDGEPKKENFKMPEFKLSGFHLSAGAVGPNGKAELGADVSAKEPNVKGDGPCGGRR